MGKSKSKLKRDEENVDESEHVDEHKIEENIPIDPKQSIGTQLVTCSSTQSVKVLDHSDKGEPKCTAECKEHNAPIMEQLNEEMKTEIESKNETKSDTEIRAKEKNEEKIIEKINDKLEDKTKEKLEPKIGCYRITSTSKAFSNLERNMHSVHQEIVHDIEYNYFGKRLATCSSDQSVKIWDHSDTGEWKCTADWKAHNAAVFRVHWAHPKFGQLLVTCSFDRTAIVWDESFKPTRGENKSRDPIWIKRHSFECRSSVTDIRFSPNTLSLVIAICTAKGVIELHEAEDHMILSDWTLQSTIECNAYCSCISWNSYFRTVKPLIAIGFEDINAYNTVSVYANENENKWIKLENVITIEDQVHEISFAPNLGRPYEMLAVATKRNVKLISIKQMEAIESEDESHWETESESESNSFELFEVRLMTDLYENSTEVWRLSWNIMGNILATFGNDEVVRLWTTDPNYTNYTNDTKRWKNVAVIDGDSDHVNYFKYAKQ